jgi:hypothetical protein
VQLCAPASPTSFEHVRVMQEAIEQRGDVRITEQVAQSSIGRFDLRIVNARSWRRMISSRSLRGGVSEFPHAEVVGDRQWHRCEFHERVFPDAAERPDLRATCGLLGK